MGFYGGYNPFGDYGYPAGGPMPVPVPLPAASAPSATPPATSTPAAAPANGEDSFENSEKPPPKKKGLDGFVKGFAYGGVNMIKDMFTLPGMFMLAGTTVLTVLTGAAFLPLYLTIIGGVYAGGQILKGLSDKDTETIGTGTFAALATVLFGGAPDHIKIGDTKLHLRDSAGGGGKSGWKQQWKAVFGKAKYYEKDAEGQPMTENAKHSLWELIGESRHDMADRLKNSNQKNLSWSARRKAEKAARALDAANQPVKRSFTDKVLRRNKPEPVENSSPPQLDEIASSGSKATGKDAKPRSLKHADMATQLLDEGVDSLTTEQRLALPAYTDGKTGHATQEPDRRGRFAGLDITSPRDTAVPLVTDSNVSNRPNFLRRLFSTKHEETASNGSSGSSHVSGEVPESEGSVASDTGSETDSLHSAEHASEQGHTPDTGRGTGGVGTKPRAVPEIHAELKASKEKLDLGKISSDTYNKQERRLHEELIRIPKHLQRNLKQAVEAMETLETKGKPSYKTQASYNRELKDAQKRIVKAQEKIDEHLETRLDNWETQEASQEEVLFSEGQTPAVKAYKKRIEDLKQIGERELTPEELKTYATQAGSPARKEDLARMADYHQHQFSGNLDAKMRERINPTVYHNLAQLYPEWDHVLGLQGSQPELAGKWLHQLQADEKVKLFETRSLTVLEKRALLDTRINWWEAQHESSEVDNLHPTLVALKQAKTLLPKYSPETSLIMDGHAYYEALTQDSPDLEKIDHLKKALEANEHPDSTDVLAKLNTLNEKRLLEQESPGPEKKAVLREEREDLLDELAGIGMDLRQSSLPEAGTDSSFGLGSAATHRPGPGNLTQSQERQWLTLMMKEDKTLTEKQKLQELENTIGLLPSDVEKSKLKALIACKEGSVRPFGRDATKNKQLADHLAQQYPEWHYALGLKERSGLSQESSALRSQWLLDLEEQHGGNIFEPEMRQRLEADAVKYPNAVKLKEQQISYLEGLQTITDSELERLNRLKAEKAATAIRPQGENAENIMKLQEAYHNGNGAEIARLQGDIKDIRDARGSQVIRGQDTILADFKHLQALRNEQETPFIASNPVEMFNLQHEEAMALHGLKHAGVPLSQGNKARLVQLERIPGNHRADYLRPESTRKTPNQVTELRSLEVQGFTKKATDLNKAIYQLENGLAENPKQVLDALGFEHPAEVAQLRTVYSSHSTAKQQKAALEKMQKEQGTTWPFPTMLKEKLDKVTEVERNGSRPAISSSQTKKDADRIRYLVSLREDPAKTLSAAEAAELRTCIEKHGQNGKLLEAYCVNKANPDLHWGEPNAGSVRSNELEQLEKLFDWQDDLGQPLLEKEEQKRLAELMAKQEGWQGHYVSEGKEFVETWAAAFAGKVKSAVTTPSRTGDRIVKRVERLKLEPQDVEKLSPEAKKRYERMQKLATKIEQDEPSWTRPEPAGQSQPEAVSPPVAEQASGEATDTGYMSYFNPLISYLSDGT